MQLIAFVQSPQGTSGAVGPFESQVEADSVAETLPEGWHFLGISPLHATLTDAQEYVAASEAEVHEEPVPDPDL